MREFKRVRTSRRSNAEAGISLRKRRRWYVDLTVTAANVLASSTAKKRQVVAGATITAGQPVYEDSADSFAAKPAQADATDSDVVAGIALHAASDGQPLEIVYEDDSFTPGATLAVGQVYCLSAAAAGGIAPASDLVSTNLVTVLFVALTAAVGKLRIINSETVKA